jgi:E3 ubiquitin-protein ligase BRE1
MDELRRLRGSDQDTIKDLKAQLKRAQNDVKEMKLLLDMYKTSTKEQRDKAQLMAAEKKVRAELEETRNQVSQKKILITYAGFSVIPYFQI